MFLECHLCVKLLHDAVLQRIPLIVLFKTKVTKAEHDDTVDVEATTGWG
jgi:hypothetical protein